MSKATDNEDDYRDFPGRALLISLFRIGHVAGLVGVAAWVLGGQDLAAAGAAAMPVFVHGAAFAFLLVGAGLGILAVDAWSNPSHFRQVNGLAVILKLVLVALMVVWGEARVFLFWTILVYSVAISHAPGRIRPRRLF